MDPRLGPVALDALGNPIRRAILEGLRAGPKSVGEIAGGFSISRPAVSRHLKVLSDAGLVIHHPQGRRNVFALHPDGFAAVQAYLGAFWDEALIRFRIVAENRSP